MGGWTRQAGDAANEIEERMSNPKEFLPDDGELAPGQNPNKFGFEQTKHDDFNDEALPSKFNSKVQKSLAAAGNAKDQAMLDELDAEQYQMNVKIKPMTSQFPGGPEKFYRNEHGLSAKKRMAVHNQLQELLEMSGLKAKVQPIGNRMAISVPTMDHVVKIVNALRRSKVFDVGTILKNDNGFVIQATHAH